MANKQPDVFEYGPAVRAQVPLLIGLVGPSGTGKTVSALRLAHGIRRVTGGDVALVDTEGKRGLHYADQFGFKFHYLPFPAPFGPERYLAAIDFAAAKGAKVIVVDSFSHEWEGEGGILERHDAVLDRMAKGNDEARESKTFAAWKEPKADHQRLVSGILQRDVSLVFCFRAKEKKKPEKGKGILNRGYQIVGDEMFRFELTLSFFLKPGADGVPTWKSANPEEQVNMKIPEQFREILREPKQLSEDIGERLARWAAGDAAAPESPAEATKRIKNVPELIAAYAQCKDAAALAALEARRAEVWEKCNQIARRDLLTAFEDANGRIGGERSGLDESPADALLDNASSNDH